jgi:hypothetical protein
LHPLCPQTRQGSPGTADKTQVCLSGNGITISDVPAINFLWDPRPGSNIDHIAAHGMTTQQWESVFHNADRREEDKDEPSFVVAEGRLKKRLFRIVYELDGDVVVPILHHSNHGLSHHTSRPSKE